VWAHSRYFTARYGKYSEKQRLTPFFAEACLRFFLKMPYLLFFSHFKYKFAYFRGCSGFVRVLFPDRLRAGGTKETGMILLQRDSVRQYWNSFKI
jgi:hypothetical protein